MTVPEAPNPAADEPVEAPAARGRPVRPSGRSAFLPIALLGLAVTVGAGATLHQAWREHEALTAARAGQEHPYENARKMREALDRIASETQILANKGNPNARLIVDELGRRGITIRTDTSHPAPAPQR